MAEHVASTPGRNNNGRHLAGDVAALQTAIDSLENHLTITQAPQRNQPAFRQTDLSNNSATPESHDTGTLKEKVDVLQEVMDNLENNLHNIAQAELTGNRRLQGTVLQDMEHSDRSDNAPEVFLLDLKETMKSSRSPSIPEETLDDTNHHQRYVESWLVNSQFP